jgi:murein DD-endopeptidase MepM/ murein hydrolase activator NlpD
MEIRPNTIFPDYPDWNLVNIADYHHLILKGGGWLKELESLFGGKSYGGFLENRSAIFDHRHDTKKVIHLGVDYWVDVGTPVISPVEGTIMNLRSSKNESCRGGWGNRVDILSGGKVYMFAHLSPESICGKQSGDKVLEGDVLGSAGAREHNGGWRPHLHLQCVALPFYDAFPDMDAYAEPDSEEIENCFEV